MKLKISILLLILFSVSSLYSQQYYAKFYGGYGVGISPKEFTYQNQSGLTNIYAVGIKNLYFGTGANINLALGCFLNSHIGYELEIRYSKSSDMAVSNYYESSNFTEWYDHTYSSIAFFISPAVFITAELNSLNPYLKIGPVFMLPKITEVQSTTTTDMVGEGKSNRQLEYILDGGVAIGLNSSLGATVKITRIFNLFIELNSKNMSYTPRHGKLKDARLNGESYIDRVAMDSREIDFVDKLSNDGSINTNLHQHLLKTNYPFSILSLSAGISLLF